MKPYPIRIWNWKLLEFYTTNNFGWVKMFGKKIAYKDDRITWYNNKFGVSFTIGHWRIGGLKQ